MKEVTIGPLEQFTQFPAEVHLERRPYYLMESAEGYKLMSRVCPHAGVTVDIEGDEIVCPMHYWTFELHSGRCINVPSAELQTYEVNLEAGNLIAKFPETQY